MTGIRQNWLVAASEREGPLDEGAPSQVFRPAAGRWFGYAWLVFAALNLGDIAVRGRDRDSFVAAAALLLATAIVYVTSLRPRIAADGAGVHIANPLRDVRVPWGAVTKVDALDAIRVHTGGDGYVRCWVFQAANRRRVRELSRRADATAPGRRTSASGPSRGIQEELAGRTRADFIASELESMAKRFRRASAEAGHTRASVTWSPWAVGALCGSLLLVIASLVIR